MMAKKILLLILLYCLVSVGVQAQTNTFIKWYDNIAGTQSNHGGNIVITPDGYLVRIISISNVGYSGIAVIKIDTNGIKQWDRLFTLENGELSAAKNFVPIGDTGYLITGEAGHVGYVGVFFLHINANGDSLNFREYTMPGYRVGYAIATLVGDSLLCPMYYGNIPTSYTNLKMLKMDTCLSVPTEVPLSVAAYGWNTVTCLIPSIDSLSLYLSIKHSTASSYNHYFTIRKTDLSNDTLRNRLLSGYTTMTSTPNKILVLPNGNIVTHWYNQQEDSWSHTNPYLICLNSELDSVWRYNFNTNVYPKFPLQIKLAANGDIIGCGYTDNVNYNYSCAWLFRISPQGQLLWEREYISPTFVNYLALESVAEDDQGNLVATGFILDTLANGGATGKAVLLKVLSNGCFTPNCNGGAEDTLIVASTVTGVAPHLLLPPKEGNGRLMVFPNPANNQLQVLLPNSPNRQNATLQLIDLQGRVLKSATLPTTTNSPFVNLSTTELPNGMYVLTYTVLGVVQSRAKVVVNHATN